MDPNQDPWAVDTSQPATQEKKESITKEKPKENQKTSILTILSLIFSIITPPLGLILSIIALIKIKNSPNLKGRVLAKTGLIISIVILVLAITAFILLVFVFKKYSISFL